MALSFALYGCSGNDEPVGPSSIPTGIYSIVGTVKTEDNYWAPNVEVPLKNVEVTLKFETAKKVLTQTAITDEKGQYFFTDLGAGEYTIVVNTDVYESAPIKVSLQTDVKIVDFTVKLKSLFVSPHIIMSADSLDLTTSDYIGKIRLSLVNVENEASTEKYEYSVGLANVKTAIDTIKPGSGFLTKASPYVDIEFKANRLVGNRDITPREYVFAAKDGDICYNTPIKVNFKYQDPTSVELEQTEPFNGTATQYLCDFGKNDVTKEFKIKSNIAQPQTISVDLLPQGETYVTAMVKSGSQTKQFSNSKTTKFTLPANGEATISITANRQKLSEYNGRVMSIKDCSGLIHRISAKWDETPSNTLSFSTDVLDFGSSATKKSVYITNNGKNSVDWELSEIPDWITSISRTSGTLGAGQKVEVVMETCRFYVSSAMQQNLRLRANGQDKYLSVRISPNTWNYAASNITSPASDRIRFNVTGCRRECDSNTVYVYFTATNVGTQSYYVSLTMRYVYSDTRANDDLGNTYKCVYLEFADVYSEGTSPGTPNASGPISCGAQLAPGVTVKGVLRYDDVAKDATMFKAVNIKGENTVQGTITFLNVPIQR